MRSALSPRCSVQQLLRACPEDKNRERVRRLQRQLTSKSDGDSSDTSLRVLGRPMNGFPDLLIGTAATDVAAHGFIDVGIGRIRFLCQKSRGRHDLARLTVTALRNVDFDPRLLNRMTAVG